MQAICVCECLCVNTSFMYMAYMYTGQVYRKSLTVPVQVVGVTCAQVDVVIVIKVLGHFFRYRLRFTG